MEKTSQTSDMNFFFHESLSEDIESQGTFHILKTKKSSKIKLNSFSAQFIDGNLLANLVEKKTNQIWIIC